jgi:sugar/nucleoside kinase (ribokinase family)
VDTRQRPATWRTPSRDRWCCVGGWTGAAPWARRAAVAHRAHDRLLHRHIVVDLVGRSRQLPVRGGDVVATRSWTTPGGGFNVMAAAARQGAPVVYAGAHGSGPFGDGVRAALRAEGIEILLPARTDRDTGFVTSLVDAEGERTFVTSPGAESVARAGDLARVSAPLPDDLVYLSGYSMMHPANRAGARPPGCRGSIRRGAGGRRPGPAGARDSPGTPCAAALARVDWWSCNEREAALLTGLGNPGEAARALGSRIGRGSVLVRIGAEGCLLFHEGALLPVPGYAVDAIDLNGAGDAHTGAFIAALIHGLDPRTAARHANAAAALATTVRGPATAPDARSLLEFLQGEGGRRRAVPGGGGGRAGKARHPHSIHIQAVAVVAGDL